MFKPLVFFGCLALIAAPLTIGFPAFAQQPAEPIPQMQAPPNGPAGGHGAWNGECPERQELREEREKIRTEHEALESEHDTLKTQCMNVKGQDRTACHERAEALRARAEALHERMKALHDRVEADPGCHPKGAHKGPWPERQVPAGSPAPSMPVTPLNTPQ